MSYFNENANPWLPHQSNYQNPLVPPDNSEQRVQQWKNFADKLAANFQAVVRDRDQVVEQRDARAAERNAWRETAKEIRNQYAPEMPNEKLNAIYDQKKAVSFEEIAREKAAMSGKN